MVIYFIYQKLFRLHFHCGGDVANTNFAVNAAKKPYVKIGISLLHRSAHLFYDLHVCFHQSYFVSA